MNKLIFLTLFSFSLIVVACTDENDDACSKVESLGSFSLDASSRAAIPYQPTDVKAIFSDSLGQERSLDIILQGDGFITQEFLAVCGSDSTSLSPYEWETERICYELKDEANGSFSYQICAEMQYNLLQPQEKRVADVLNISSYSSSSILQQEGEYGILLAARNFGGFIDLPGSVELLDQFVWEGRSLEQVYQLETTNNLGQTRELYYTRAEGLVAFRDYFSDTFYFFDRIE